MITPKTVTISVNSEASTSYKYSGVWGDTELTGLFVSPIDIKGETLLLAFEITHDGAPATVVQYIGEYNIVATLRESYTNYTAAEVETTLNITAKEIIVSAETGGKTYDGQAVTVSELQALFTVNNAIDENSWADLIVNFSEGEVKDAKEYTVTVSLPENYNKMYVLIGDLPPTTYTISPKEIEVNWGEISFEYDGTPKAPAPTADTGIEGESVTIEVTVQEGSAVNVGTYNATASQSNTNYTLTNTTSVFDITAAALKDLAVSLEDWTYGGTADTPAVTGNTGGGTATVTYSGTAYDGTEYADSELAPDRAGKYTVKVSVDANGNYAEGRAQSTFEILRATLTDKTVVVSVTYDGAEHGLTIALTGFVKGDSFDTASGKAISYGTEEGIYSAEPVTVTNVSDSKTVYYKAEFHNYDTVESSRSVTVTPLTVAIEWCENNFTYNGKVQTVSATYKDIDDVDIALNVTTDDREFKNAGNYTATAAFGNGETNYALPATVTAAYEIKKAASVIDITGVATVYTYTGEEQTVTGATLNHGETELVYSDNTFTTVAEGNGKTVTITAAESANYFEASATVTITVNKLKVNKPSATVTEFVYDNTEKTLLPDGERYTVAEGKATKAGKYTATVSLSDIDNTEWSDGGASSFDIKWEILKADYDMRNVSFTDKEFEYDGREHTVTVEGELPVGLDGIRVTVSYNGASVTDVKDGRVAVTATFSTTSTNYNAPAPMNAYVSVYAKTVAIEWCDNNFTYDGNIQTITASYKDINNAEVALAVTVKADGAEAEFRNAGNYTVTASFAYGETNYALPATVTAAYEIKKAASVIDVSGVPTEYTYTGKEQTVTGATLNHGETELVYTNNTFTTVAEGNGKTVTITAAESANYFGASATVTITVNKLKVDKPSVSVTEFVYDNTEKTLISDISDGERYTVAEGKATKAGKYTAKISLKDTDNTEWSDGGASSFGIEWEILKADYKMTNVSFSDKTFEYDGQSHTVTVEGVLPTGLDGIQLTVTYSGGTVTDVKDGSVTVTATFSTTSTNYNAPDPMDAYISVYARTVDIVWCANDFTYNGNVQTVTAYYKDISNAEVALAVTIEADRAEAEFKNAGDYTAEAVFKNGETNYALPDNATAIYEIKKLEVSVIADNAEMPYGSTPANLTWRYAEGSAEFVETDGITLTVITGALPAATITRISSK